MQLSHQDFDALQNAILELYEYRDLENFRKGVPAILLKIIPADNFHWQEAQLNFRTKQVKTVDHFEAFPIDTRAFDGADAAVFAHPFTAHFMQTGVPTALKLSDFLTLTQFENSALYQEVYRHFQVRRALSTAIALSTNSGSSINFHSARGDFTERDRFITNLLRPHFDQAHRNARLNTQRAGTCSRPLAAYELTPREIEIAAWLANGKTNPEIAILLNISARTVEKHMEKILEKLGVENRTTAAVIIANSTSVGPKR
ncbi:MAG: hypothetical protein JWM16_1391 [Verrucomicrobiales bacterium]|nr:hypothetical protein [Verrucomicrobiales bacterium]